MSTTKVDWTKTAERNALEEAKLRELKKGVFTFFDVSTGHITKKDDELIQRDDFPLGCYPYDQGYFILAGDGAFSTYEKDLREFGMSEAFIKVWRCACDLGCYFLRLDCDSCEYEQFEKFEW